MTQKRPCDDELVNSVSLKHHRCIKEDDCSTSHLEFVSSEEASEKLHASGEGGFMENHLEDEKINTNGFTAKLPEANKDNDAEVPRPLSPSAWAASNTSEEDETLDLLVPLPLALEYFSFSRPVRPPVHADDLYHSLLDYPPRKSVPIGPKHQADVPELSQRNPVSDVNDDLAGICIIPRPEPDLPTLDVAGVGVGRTNCSCEDTGSTRCVRQHIMEAREKLMTTLGQDAFTELGFSEMGEVVAEKWSQEEEDLFYRVVHRNSLSLGKNFWNTLYAVFPSRTKMEIVSYYFNVFMLRNRAEQNRYDPTNIDSDDDEWQLIDDDEEDESGVESPLCHDDDDDAHRCHVGSFSEPSKDLVVDKDGSCTSSDSGAPAEIPQENGDCGKEWCESILEAYDARAWNGDFCCRKDEVDFLPTCSVIEEVFGDGTLDSQTEMW